MKVALYIGNHTGDSLPVRAGWWLTRKVQKGPLALVTHTEAILREFKDGTVTIASASVRDGGVRSKRARLNPAHWRIVDVPFWDVNKSIALLDLTEGMPYDWRGAIATVFLGSEDPEAYFCNEWTGEKHIVGSANFSPSQFAAIALSLGRDVTQEFFKQRKGA